MGMECSYCGQAWKERNKCCSHCGAPNKQAEINRFEPFFYDGYIVYKIREPQLRSDMFVFYKGITLIGTIRIHDIEFEHLPPAEDFMPLVMERLNATIQI